MQLGRQVVQGTHHAARQLVSAGEFGLYQAGQMNQVVQLGPHGLCGRVRLLGPGRRGVGRGRTTSPEPSSLSRLASSSFVMIASS